MGQKFPQLEATDVFGKSVVLPSAESQHNLYIGFFRNATCPFCSLYTYQLAKRSGEFAEKGLRMVFIFEAKNQQIVNSAFLKDMEAVTLISDPTRGLYQQYGVDKSLIGMVRTMVKGQMKVKQQILEKEGINLPASEASATMPAEIILDKNGNVLKAHYSKDLDDRLGLAALEAYLPERQTAIK